MIENKTIKKETSPQKEVPTGMVAQSQHEVKESEPQPTLDIDLWIETRKEFKTKVGSIMLLGSDYHVIQGKKSLAKGGAEKIASIFGWSAEFLMDEETLKMVGDPKGILAYVCNLKDRSGRIVGQGRGASSLATNKNDVNRAVKMAQKSAFIDAVLRSSGLSDIYTQDLEDMPDQSFGGSVVNNIKRDTWGLKPKESDTWSSKPKARPASEKQKKLIADLMNQKGYKLADLIDEGFGEGSNPRELIDWLFKAPSKIVNGQPVIEYTPTQKAEIDEIGKGVN